MTDNDKSIRRRGLLAGSALAAGGALLLPRTGAAQDWSAQERANVESVRSFCRAWSTLDLGQVTSHMTEQSVYRMTEDTPPVTGHQALIDQMQPWVDTSSTIVFKILDTFAKGPMVVNHRIDTFASDTRPLTWEGVGVFLLEEGKIREWFDYTIRVQRG